MANITVACITYHACALQQFGAVKLVGGNVRCVGCRNSLEGQLDGWESVHGAVRRVAKNTLKFVKCISQGAATALERVCTINIIYQM